jgi:transcriptional regulator of arginine metabolism
MKMERKQAILELVRTRDIFTQEELTEALGEMGIQAAQATVSRDIRQLRLTKEATADGQKYVAPEGRSSGGDPHSRAFRDGILDAVAAGNMLVIHTHTGMAASVGVAFDALEFAGVVGSVAGDNTIIVVMQSDALAADLAARLGA